MSEQDDEWSDYESGPFCRHWSDPSDCDEKCGRCGHTCTEHGYGYDDDSCNVDGCECKGWLGETPGDCALWNQK